MPFLSTASESDYSGKAKSVLTEIPVGNNSLWIRVYVFNSLDDGKKISEEVYGIKNFDLIAKEENFSRLQRMIPGDVIQGYEYGMFKTESEFWLFKNRGDGYLYGIGCYLNRK